MCKYGVLWGSEITKKLKHETWAQVENFKHNDENS